MHSKDNSKLNNFIQGLRPFSNSIPKTLKKHLKKGGYNYSNIVDNWTKMVSKKISDCCYPITVKMGKEMRNGTLVLNVLHGKELEIEYSKKEIIDKINAFFGYNCINQVTLKIVQEKIKTTRDISHQIVRHRSFSFQEFSQRYAVSDTFEIRESRLQDAKNRQDSIALDYEDEYHRRINEDFSMSQHAVLQTARELFDSLIDRI